MKRIKVFNTNEFPEDVYIDYNVSLDENVEGYQPWVIGDMAKRSGFTKHDDACCVKVDNWLQLHGGLDNELVLIYSE